MLLSFSIVIIISMIFITSISISTYSKKLETNNVKYSNQVLNNLIGNIDNYLHEIDNIIYHIVYNYYIQIYLLGQDDVLDETSFGIRIDDSYQASHELLSYIINLREDILGIYIVKDSTVVLSKDILKKPNEIGGYTSEELLQDISENNKETFIFTPRQVVLEDDIYNIFSTVKTIERYDGQGDLGIVLINTNLSIIERYCNSATSDNSNVILITDDKGNLVYNTDITYEPLINNEEGLFNLLNLHFNETPKSSQKGSFSTTLDNETYNVVYQKDLRTGWWFANVTPYSFILDEVSAIKNYITIFTALSLIIILLVTYGISTRITTPLINLKNAMDMADHKLNALVEVTSKDEVGILSDSFNSMIRRIRNLMNQVRKEQSEKRKAELKVLQDQINPHFLYNTLDSIIWMAEDGDTNTVPMIEALSSLFRISLSKGQEFITLKEEIDHVTNYLYILSMRYYNKFDYKIDIDDALLEKVRIPKIILQPLVENAIYHGIKEKESKGHIIITAKQIQNDIVISINDDGLGMDSLQCEKILNGTNVDSSKSGSGIGVINVDQRIKLYYGSYYGLSYKSEIGHGTTVTLTIPIISKHI